MADLGITGAMRLIHDKADAHTRDRATQTRDIAATLHENAPRGGTNLNMFGQPRSAPGEQPAIETGWLLDQIEAGPQPAGDMTYDVTVNRVHLEFGTVHILERPMGLMTITALKREVNGE